MFWSVTIQRPLIVLVFHPFSKTDENTFYHSVAVGDTLGSEKEHGLPFSFFNEKKIQKERLYSSDDI